MIEIVDYAERWPGEFAQIASRLRRAAGDLALRIDHIGSTSVPGLAAKDVIDVQLTVGSLEPVAPLQSALSTAGYVQSEGVIADHLPPGAMGPDTEWEKRLFHPDGKSRPVHLHVRVHGRANQRYALLFRDYLRAHPRAAAAYAEVKRRLTEYHAHDRHAYVTIKDPVCDIISSAAEDWAALANWHPGPSDA